jgi:cobalt-zinc-cadmium efflux system membrane fusion protein
VGQTLEIQFPFLAEKIEGKVQYVANEVSKETRAVKIRASIPNPGARLKSDMLVKAILDIPPKAGQTRIPRLAMVSAGGTDYVFVRKPRATSDHDSKDQPVDRFERRVVEVAQENHDKVIVCRGLKAGEEIVTLGSLILAQLYDDALTVATGTSEK